MQLDSDIQLLPIHEQVVYVQSLVKAHYANCNGTLELWGNIQRYVFYCAKGCVLTLNGDGVILQENPTVNISCATLSVKNQDVMNLFIKK
ncbi:hypothetical protein [Psychromonas sp. CD1]|uniref:hypothetical protein n=1 Tax=Psychromonas sp. CD1 TaxID=1979839 RepID=UPI00117BD3F9|nr:hypothetical protein [Psychromonas sp. CD1]